MADHLSSSQPFLDPRNKQSFPPYSNRLQLAVEALHAVKQSQNIVPAPRPPPPPPPPPPSSLQQSHPRSELPSDTILRLLKGQDNHASLISSHQPSSSAARPFTAQYGSLASTEHAEFSDFSRTHEDLAYAGFQVSGVPGFPLPASMLSMQNAAARKTPVRTTVTIARPFNVSEETEVDQPRVAVRMPLPYSSSRPSASTSSETNPAARSFAFDNAPVHTFHTGRSFQPVFDPAALQPGGFAPMPFAYDSLSAGYEGPPSVAYTVPAVAESSYGPLPSNLDSLVQGQVFLPLEANEYSRFYSRG